MTNMTKIDKYLQYEPSPIYYDEYDEYDEYDQYESRFNKFYMQIYSKLKII